MIPPRSNSGVCIFSLDTVWTQVRTKSLEYLRVGVSVWFLLADVFRLFVSSERKCSIVLLLRSPIFGPIFRGFLGAPFRLAIGGGLVQLTPV
jgi:hypothetical protein